MLIIFGGLPGCGKTTIARALAGTLGAVVLRIDSIEQAIVRSRLSPRSVIDAGYLVGYAVAEDNLTLGHTVIADSVNPITTTRRAWRRVATTAGVSYCEIELLCSDADEHRQRVETRRSDIQGMIPPTWHQVVSRHYVPWSSPNLSLDTAGRTVDACVADILLVVRGISSIDLS